MIELFKSCFNKTNDCIILAVPLVVFLSVLGWFLNFSLNAADTPVKCICAGMTFFVMFCGFCSSLLYTAKKSLELSGKIYIFEKDRMKDIYNLIFAIPKGVGRLFVPVTGITAFYVLIYTVIFLAVNYFITKYAGMINFSDFNVNLLALSLNSFFEIIEKLEPSDIKIMELWYVSMFASMLIVSFVTFLWLPEIVYVRQNTFKALFSSIRKVFANFWEVFVLFVYAAFIVKLLSVVNTMLLFVPIAYFFVLLVTCYFIVYLIVLLFTYYEQKFVKTAE